MKFSNSQEIDLAWIKKLNYTQNIINETLRLFPPVPFLVMKIAINDVKIKDIVIPAGSITNTWIFACSNNDKFFINPD